MTVYVVVTQHCCSGEDGPCYSVAPPAHATKAAADAAARAGAVDLLLAVREDAVRHCVAALLRGSLQARAQALVTLVQFGFDADVTAEALEAWLALPDTRDRFRTEAAAQVAEAEQARAGAGADAWAVGYVGFRVHALEVADAASPRL